jgi:hypothetical protein
VTEFAEYFKLKDQGRSDFRLNPDRDADLYVDLDQILGKIRPNLAAPAPKGVIEGGFGTGKSHVLHYIQRRLAPEHRFEPLYVSLSGFNRKSDFYSVHSQIMAVLLPVIEKLMQRADYRREIIDEIPYVSGDMKTALIGLSRASIPSFPQSDAVSARQWLMNSRLLQAKSASKAGYSGRVSEVIKPSGLVKLYRALSWLHHHVTQKRLHLLIDEGESFSRIVDEDAQVDIGAGLRDLFDSENNDIGVFLGLTTPRNRRGTHPMLRADVVTRVGSRHWHLQPLNTPDRIRRFLDGVWRQLTTESASPNFLLEPAAVELLTTKLNAICRILIPADQLMADPTQRNLLDVLSLIGTSAVETHASSLIRARDIAEWLQLKGT